MNARTALARLLRSPHGRCLQESAMAGRPRPCGDPECKVIARHYEAEAWRDQLRRQKEQR